ncbi:MAG: hypothetical protein Q9226_007411 [Calogaya cf. arnoldii]
MSLWICGGGLVWGSFQILVPRQRLPPQALEAESSWNFGQILPIMLLVVPVLSFAQGYTAQKAEKDRKDIQERIPYSPNSSEYQAGSRNMDEASSMVQTATKHHSDSVNASNAASVLGRATCNTQNTAEEDRIRGTTHLPPWRDDSQIYDSRFIIFAFWGSQVGILALGTFIVIYRGLFLPLGILVHRKTEQTLLTESWIWLIVGCTIALNILVAIALLIGGAIFSSLFVISDDGMDEGEEL